jgi:hypothetical protein
MSFLVEMLIMLIFDLVGNLLIEGYRIVASGLRIRIQPFWVRPDRRKT